MNKRDIKALEDLANALDSKGEFKLANSIDDIIKEAAEWRGFVDKRPEEERAKDKERYSDPHIYEEFGLFKEHGARPGESDPRRYMVGDSMFGDLSELSESQWPELEWEPKEERDLDREKNVEELSEEDLSPEYLEEMMGAK